MKSPLTLLRLYLIQLWIHLSVIQKKTNQLQKTTTTFNRTYLGSFVLYSIAIFHGTIGLHFESGEPLTLSHLQHSKYIYFRQFFLPQIWPQMDIMMYFAAFAPGGLLLDFVWKRLEWQYQFMIGSADERVKLAGKELSTYESTKLVAIFRLARLVCNLFFLVLYILGFIYCQGMVFLVTKIYFVSFWSLSFFLLEWPFIILFCFQFNVVNLTHIIVAGSCIQTRQRHHCSLFSRSLAKLITKTRPSLRQLQCICWPDYLTFNQAVLSINRQLEAFNAFYTNYLTVIFAGYTICQVILAYIVFYAPAQSTAMLVLKGAFTVLLIEMSTLLFGLIQYCACVVKRNGQIGRLNRQFGVHCLRYQTRYRLSAKQLLKIELFQWPRLLHFYAFKLFGGSRITSKTFYAMTINIICFFLFVMKQTC